jgi:hypothetical protein
MKYVYLLRSIKFPVQTYIGLTSDVQKRLAAHNAGQSPHISKFTPWELVAYFGLTRPKKDRPEICPLQGNILLPLPIFVRAGETVQTRKNNFFTAPQMLSCANISILFFPPNKANRSFSASSTVAYLNLSITMYY